MIVCIFWKDNFNIPSLSLHFKLLHSSYTNGGISLFVIFFNVVPSWQLTTEWVNIFWEMKNRQEIRTNETLQDKVQKLKATDQLKAGAKIA